MDIARLWKDRRYNGVERVRKEYFPYFQRQPENPSLTTMQFGGTIRPKEKVFSSRLAPASRDSFNTNVQRFAAICRRGTILVFFRAQPVLLKLSSASRRRDPSDLWALLLSAADLRRFQAKTFGAPPALSNYACNRALFDFPVEQWHSLEQWSLAIFRFLDIYIAFSIVGLPSWRLLFLILFSVAKEKVKSCKISLAVNIGKLRRCCTCSLDFHDK